MKESPAVWSLLQSVKGKVYSNGHALIFNVI